MWSTSTAKLASLGTSTSSKPSIMRLQLRSTFILLQACCCLASTAYRTRNEQQLPNVPLVEGIPIVSSQARTARIAEFVSSHKISENVHRNDAQLLDHVDYKNDEEIEDQTNIELETYDNMGLLYEDQLPLNRNSSQQIRQFSNDKENFRDKEKILSDARISSENPTTILPVLTTQRDTGLFDFVPVNIVREDAKGNPFVSFDNKNFEDLGDINLVPAGSNTRIQVKKGPNGKDYEYEYVYYYYDEEEEGKGGEAVSNSQDAPTRTSAPTSNSRISSRRGNFNRNKYNTFDRSTTIESVINEVIPNRNGSRARQLDNSHEDVSEERLPTNTRFPPRSRISQDMETTERASWVRGNRQRATVDSVNSSSFREQQEGPEFPQNLPNGPVRFLGVTPNEGSEDKTTLRGHGRPQKIQDPALVRESNQEQTYSRKRPVVVEYDASDELERVQPQTQTQFRQHPYSSREDDFGVQITSIPISSSSISSQEDRISYTDIVTEVTDSPTTQMSQAMDKVALDLYAFLQQGRSNLVDSVKDTEDDSLTTQPPSEFDESITLTDTELEDSTSTVDPPTTTPTSSITSTTTITSTTVSTTTTTNRSSPSFEEPNNGILALSRGKFRRPGIGSPAVSRNRFKSGAVLPNFNSADAKATDVSPVINSIQKTHGRFGQNSGNGGFKRTRPSGQTQSQQPSLTLGEKVQKESVEKMISEIKPMAGRGRFRGGAARLGSQAKTTHTSYIREKLSTTPGVPSSIMSTGSHRLGFNKLSPIGRRRGTRPAGEQNVSSSERTTTAVNLTQENNSGEQQRPMAKLPTTGIRTKSLNKSIIKPGAGRLNLRPRPGQSTTMSTTEVVAGDTALVLPSVEGIIDEPASEGTEEETREALAESSLTIRPITINQLNKLRNRNRIQVQPKTTTVRISLPPALRRSSLLPRRKTMETPLDSIEPVTDIQPDPVLVFGEYESTELSHLAPEVNASTYLKHEELTKGLNSLLAPRRRIAPRRLGKLTFPTSE